MSWFVLITALSWKKIKAKAGRPDKLSHEEAVKKYDAARAHEITLAQAFYTAALHRELELLNEFAEQDVNMNLPLPYLNSLGIGKGEATDGDATKYFFFRGNENAPDDEKGLTELENDPRLR